MLSPPGQAVPCLATSDCRLRWWLAENPDTAALVQGGIIPAAPQQSCCAPLHPPAASLGRFLCGTVNDFVAEVGRAYKRATENKQEAELMARKVGCWRAGACRVTWRGLLWRSVHAQGWAALGVPEPLGCPGKHGVSRQRWGALVLRMPGPLGCPGKHRVPGKHPVVAVGSGWCQRAERGGRPAVRHAE